MSKKAIIIGAGPAGLTAAYEMLRHTDVKPVILEAEDFIGGLSRTCNYNGHKMDLGGHRFFSKSARVMAWWQEIMPLQSAPSCDDLLLQRPRHPIPRPIEADPEKEDRVMLIRTRLSRIYFLRRFFNYPLALNLDTMLGLGMWRMAKIGASYLTSAILPITPEKSLKDFFINRFGAKLYKLFFRDYTEKVWGVKCEKIPAKWGTQRIKDVSMSKVLHQALKKCVGIKDSSLKQNKTSASLIEQFIYPKLGPGQLWETVADEIRRLGGEIHLETRVTEIEWHKDKITAVKTVGKNGVAQKITADYCLSTMPVRDLVKSFSPDAPERVKIIGDGLVYRDFRTVGLLVSSLKLKNRTKIKTVNGLIPDTWIYIQDRDVKAGRLQIYNNWSPYLVENWQNTVWLGVEYFCNKGDDIWQKSDADMIALAVKELEQIGIIEKSAMLDGCSFKAEKAYPAYFGSYDQFDEIRNFTDRFENLFMLGRNGMHRYNNMDHSMLTAMAAVDNIAAGITCKNNLWDISDDPEYHEGQ